MWYLANVLLICLAPHPLLILPSHTRHWCLLHGMLWSCLMPRAHTLDWSPQMLITETGMSWDNSTLNLFWPSTICGIYPHTLANTHTRARMFFFSLTHMWCWSRSPVNFSAKTLHLHIRDVFHVRLRHQDGEILDPWFLIDTRDPRGIAKARARTSWAEPQQPE